MPLFLRSRRGSIIAILSGTLIIILMVAAGWSWSKSKKDKAVAANARLDEPRIIEVATAQVVARAIPMSLEATGSLAADEASDVAPETAGQVVATPVDVGAFVRQGAVIARLDDRDARLRLQQALAGERQADAAVRQAQARLGLGPGGGFDASSIPEVRAAFANYERAQAEAALAETNARRYESLVESGAVARSVYDQERTRAETAKAQARAARQQYETALNTARQDNQGIATVQAALDSARVQVAMAQKALSDTVIKAPISGHISDRPIAVGEYVTPASKIATILRTDPIKLRLKVPEAQVAFVRMGMSVSASVESYSDTRFEGQVTAINPAIEAASRAVIVEVDIKNTTNLLRPGMFATARVMQQGDEQAVFVPRSALLADPNTDSYRAFVIEGTTARLRVVQVAEERDGFVRILSGISSGEVVATSNLEELYEGAEVRKQ